MLTGNKDVDLKILSLLDDRELLLICADKSENSYINKLCSDENFMKNRVYEKYGHINKNKNRSWKNLYLKIVYYNDKYTNYKSVEILSEDGIKNMDLIEFFLNKGDIPEYSYPKIMRAAGKSGDIKLIHFFNKLNPDKFIYRDAIYGAAEGKHKELVYSLSKNYSIRFTDDSVFYSAVGGDEELLDYAISESKKKEKERFLQETFKHKTFLILGIQEVIYWNELALEGAAYSGNMILVRKFINKMFKGLENALGKAALGKHENVFRFIASKANKKVFKESLILKNASEGGNLNIINFLIENGADAWNEGLCGAAQGGNLDLVKFYISRGADNLNKALQCAEIGGHNDVIIYLKND